MVVVTLKNLALMGCQRQYQRQRQVVCMHDSLAGLDVFVIWQPVRWVET